MNALTTTKKEITKGQIFNAGDFAEAWGQWLKDRAESTQEGYKVTVKSFLQWLADQDIMQPTRADIIAYRDYLTTPHASRKTGEEITYTADTAARYFRGVKMFFAFLDANDLYKDITKNIRSPKTNNRDFKRDFLEKEDCLRILGSIERQTEEGKRNYCLVLACMVCGFRIIELQRANVGDLETHAGQVRLYIQGKGRTAKDDYKTIEGELLDALNDYLQIRGNAEPTAPLFASIKTNARPGGQRLSVPSLSRIIKGLLVDAGYNSHRITAHSLRHTSVTLDRKAGASMEEASKHARHSNITITQRYDHIMEKAEAKDEARILKYLFHADEATDTEKEAAEIMAKIPASKKAQALELLKALAV